MTKSPVWLLCIVWARKTAGDKPQNANSATMKHQFVCTITLMSSSQNINASLKSAQGKKTKLYLIQKFRQLRGQQKKCYCSWTDCTQESKIWVGHLRWGGNQVSGIDRWPHQSPVSLQRDGLWPSQAIEKLCDKMWGWTVIRTVNVWSKL